ncbi:MAG TPA: P27 family phage terminase small subunit [Planctomycetota bacterium]|nr:P27 family phage terminase small subunit [Planctomycetota bacterium]
MTDKIPPPPRKLGAKGRAFWRQIVTEYVLEPQHLAILEQACICLDRCEECRTDVAKNGAVLMDRFEQVKPNPAADLEIKYMRNFKAHLRELQLDVAPADQGYSRPPRLTALPGRNKKHA